MTHDTAQHLHNPDPPSKTHLTATPTKWSAEHDALLKERVAESKHSYAQIARELNARFGTAYSRNAVIGRANRLDISNKRPDQYVRPTNPNRPKLRIVRAAGNSPNLKLAYSVERDLPALRVVALDPLNLTLDDLTKDTCHYPFGDGPVYSFCGHKPFGKKPYCLAHCQISYLAPDARNQRARGQA